METRYVIRIVVIAGDSGKHLGWLRRLSTEYGMDAPAHLHGVAEARKRGELLRPDVIFVDTEVEDFSGFEGLLAVFGAKRPHLVVMSPSGRHAVEAFSVNAVDYLLLPLDVQRLRACLLRVRRIIEADQRLERRMDMETLAGYLRDHVIQVHKPHEDERVAISFGGRYRFVTTKGIRYATADRDYVDIHMVTGEVLHSTNRLSELTGKLPRHRFLRIRRSIIVNIDHVREARAYKENYEVVMDDGTRFRPGSTYKVGVRAALVNKMSPEPVRPPLTLESFGLLAKA